MSDTKNENSSKMIPILIPISGSPVLVPPQKLWRCPISGEELSALILFTAFLPSDKGHVLTSSNKELIRDLETEYELRVGRGITVPFMKIMDRLQASNISEAVIHVIPLCPYLNVQENCIKCEHKDNKGKECILVKHISVITASRLIIR